MIKAPIVTTDTVALIPAGWNSKATSNLQALDPKPLDPKGP